MACPPILDREFFAMPVDDHDLGPFPDPAAPTDADTNTALTQIVSRLQVWGGAAWKRLTLGQATKANSLSVTLASDSDTLSVSVVSALPTGANTIGAVTAPGAVALATAAQQDTGNTSMATAAFEEAALAAIDAIPEDVWAALIEENMNAGSTGEALFTASRAPVVGDIAAEVWGTVEMGDPGTFGADLTLLRQFVTNRCEEQPGNPGRITLYADDGATELLRWSLRDSNGGAVIATPGQPARRGAAT